MIYLIWTYYLIITRKVSHYLKPAQSRSVRAGAAESVRDASWIQSRAIGNADGFVVSHRTPNSVP